MIRSEYMAIKPQFLEKYSRRYQSVIDAGMAKQIIDSNKTDIDDQYSHVYKKDGNTGIINLYGPMSEDGPDWVDLYLGYSGVAYKNLNRAAKEILSDSEIQNVIVYANTPGGNIDGLDEARGNLQKVVDSGRDVTVINRGDIASAGVWYCSAANTVLAANSSVMIGSIGVVIDTMDFTGYYEEMGIKEISITNTESPNKRPNIAKAEGQAIFRKELDSLYNVFLQRVTGGRAIGTKAVKALKGEMIIAADAVKIGLMDGIEGEALSGSEPTPTKAEKPTKKETIKMDEEMKAAFAAMNDRFDKIESSHVAPQTATEKKPELSAEDKKFALNIVTGNAYSATVIGEAGKVLAGDASIATLKAMTAAVDAVTETKAGTEAAATTTEAGETIPNGEVAPGAEKVDNGVLEENPKAIAAELDRIKGAI